MTQMSHNDAIDQQAAVKYLLGELPPAQRDAYEDHYFDCAACATDLKALATFADTARELLRQEAAVSLAQASAPPRANWFAWLRPIVAVPVFAALLLVIGYQSFVTIPNATNSAKQGYPTPATDVAAPAGALLFSSTLNLHSSNVRGGDEAESHPEDKIQIHPEDGFALKFDFLPQQVFASYSGRLQDTSGHSVFQVTVPDSRRNKSIQLAIPAGRVKPGMYALIFTGGSTPNAPSTGSEVLRFRFLVEFLP
jgi:anti-sigma factor RsiW